ncbi:hypothetical protein [Methylobacterium komagatae]
MSTVLSAIERLERTVTAERATEAVGTLRGGLMEMAEAISRTKAEISALSLPGGDQTRLTSASQALDAIVRATEQATSDILGAAEAVQEAAWTLRERNVEAETCEALDRHATAIYTACSFQDLTAQRTARIIYTLRYLEDRIAAMIAIWGEEIGRVPPLGSESAQPTDEELCQLDVDRYIAMSVPSVTAAAIAAQPGSPTLHEDIVFVPVSTPLEPAAEAAVQAAIQDFNAEVLALQEVPEPEATAEAAADPYQLDWADSSSDDALMDFVLPDTEAMTLDGLDAETPEKRLALFA